MSRTIRISLAPSGVLIVVIGDPYRENPFLSRSQNLSKKAAGLGHGSGRSDLSPSPC